MSKLVIIPTPIGNLEDITLRAIRYLKEVDFIYAEDSRVTKKLLAHLQISKPVRSYHQHNEHEITRGIVNEMKSLQKLVGLVTDAGTPGISDPGYLLIKACLENGIEVECLPGPTAFVPALVKSGLPASSFCFEGFLPQKKGRASKLAKLADEERTIIFYESTHRILKALEQFSEAFGADRKASVSRELTKIHEETVNGTLGEILEYYKKNIIKGEFVIVIQGKQ